MANSEKNFEVFGKGLEEQSRASFEKTLESEKAEHNRMIEGELEKTTEQIQAIEKTQKYLQKEIEDLGAGARSQLPVEQIHFLDEESFEKMFPGSVAAQCRGTSFPQGIYMRGSLEQGNHLQFYSDLMHELVHVNSVHKYRYEHKKNKVSYYRGGYCIDSPLRKNFIPFIGFNEAITEEVALKALDKNIEDFNESFMITDQERDQRKTVYGPERTIYTKCIEAISKQEGKGESEVKADFARGLFTGNMMHLRVIEKAFGKGSLRILAMIGNPFHGENISRGRVEGQIKKYFETGDKKEREALGKEILEMEKKLKKKK